MYILNQYGGLAVLANRFPNNIKKEHAFEYALFFNIISIHHKQTPGIYIKS